MTGLLMLSTAFFVMGCFAFGGGFAVLALLQQEVVQRGWMTPERFVDLVAISQTTPGPIAVNVATFTGFQVAGVPGAVVATASVALPGMILMLIFAVCLLHFYEHPLSKALFEGLRPAVLGLVATAAWQIGKVAVVDWKGLAVFLVVAVLIAKWRLHPALIVLGSAVAGIAFF